MYASHKFDIKQLYSKQYLKLTYKDENGLHKRFNKITKLSILKSDNKNRAKRVNKFFSKKNLKLLDVGSGTGVFMYEMRKKNWKVFGKDTQVHGHNYTLHITVTGNINHDSGFLVDLGHIYCSQIQEHLVKH